MIELTSDSNDPRLRRGAGDDEPTPQHEVYLVLSEEERQKGFVRPYRDSYIHVGEKPEHPLRDLTEEEKECYASEGYVAFEKYPENPLLMVGRFWTQKQLDYEGCKAKTKMHRELAETYARDPSFYGATYCAGCRMHRPVSEFVWVVNGIASVKVVGS